MEWPLVHRSPGPKRRSLWIFAVPPLGKLLALGSCVNESVFTWSVLA
jgi:hypothetical protein